MKRSPLALCLALLFLPLLTWAQPPPPPEDADFVEMDGPPPRHEPRFGPGGKGPHGPRARGPKEARPHERWLSKLEREDPEAFRALSALRETNPGAFRDAMRHRLQREQVLIRLNDMPRAREFILGLPPEEQARLFEHLRAGRHDPHNRKGPSNEGAGFGKMEGRVMELSRAYASATEEDKPALRDELRRNIEVLFDAREESRRKGIAKLEAKLEGLKKGIEEKQAHREEIINRRLADLTDGDPGKW